MSVTLLTRDQAVERRADLLSRLGLTEEELMGRARRYELTIAERDVADEVEGLTYLLGATSEQ
ncbi:MULTISPECIES: hypothetical protein [unclassified Isoptericola]|uniref:hypothetical protein n=1 Tax=unclassified Isoptericola TaxID=2623355 RepID=UPI003659EBBC